MNINSWITWCLFFLLAFIELHLCKEILDFKVVVKLSTSRTVRLVERLKISPQSNATRFRFPASISVTLYGQEVSRCGFFYRYFGFLPTVRPQIRHDLCQRGIFCKLLQFAFQSWYKEIKIKLNKHPSSDFVNNKRFHTRIHNKMADNFRKLLDLSRPLPAVRFEKRDHLWHKSFTLTTLDLSQCFLLDS